MTNTLTPAQTQAIELRHPRILTIAGPGSGKTHTVLHRIIKLISEGTPARTICVITFTNAAAKELEKRIQASGIQDRLGYLGTLHGFCLRELQRWGKPLGYGRTITVLDAEQADELLLEAAQTVGCKSPAKKLEEARQNWHGARPQTPLEIAVALYRKNLRAASACDFDTILHDYLALAQGNHERSGFEHLIVDEFQDSGAADFAIYDMIPAANRFFVGDPDQAIYGFRGGRLENILSIAQNPAWEVIRLEGNFRCAAAICQAANHVIAHNRNRVDKQTFPMRDEAGKVSVRPNLGLDMEEASKVLNSIANDLEQGVPASDIAVLARNNATIADFIKTAEAVGIPVRKKKPTATPADWAKARAAIELLNAQDNPITCRQWLRLTRGKADADAQQAAAARAGRTSLRDAIPELRGTTGTVESLPTDLVRLGVSIESIELVGAKLAPIPDPDLASLSFAIARDLEREEEIGDGVTFTTIHGSKGREWGTVYLVAFEQEILPGVSKSADVEEARRLAFVAITRARDRLCITTAGMRRQPWGDKRHAPASPSQFILEAGL